MSLEGRRTLRITANADWFSYSIVPWLTTLQVASLHHWESQALRPYIPFLPHTISTIAAWATLLTWSSLTLCQGSGAMPFVRYENDTPDSGSAQE